MATPSFFICLLFMSSVDAFGVANRCAKPTSSKRTRVGHHDSMLSTSSCTRLHAENSDNIDDIRQALESSWNTESMGMVPKDPEAAAEAASVAVRNALDQGILSMVDVLLPQYDASQGEKLYDEVLAVEFCIALTNKLGKKSSIVVRDDRTIQTVSRILDRREKSAAFDDAKLAENDDENIKNDKKGDEDDSPDDITSDSSIVDAPREKVDSFRAKLAAEWTKEDSTKVDEDSKPTPVPSKREVLDTPKSKANLSRQYRLCSMLGEAIGMRAGADMQRAVIEAVKKNALPKPDEETIIILSAASPQELLGIRALVGQYQTTKNIILVNCRMKPLPRELAKAQTVYSILPLIAKPSGNQGDPWSTDKKDETPPRVVVMRRFPRDWEVFVDSGSGFDLAASVPATSTEQKGPSMSWIVNAVKRYLEARTR